MKSQLLVAAVSVLALTSAASAADVVTEQAPAPAPVEQAFSWSGPYIGVFGGIGTGDFEYDADTILGGIEFSDTGSGGFLGAQIGYDWQINNFVLGAYADIAASNYKAEIEGSFAGGGFDLESELKYLGTVQGRLGFAMDRALFYAHGGFAYGKTEQSGDLDLGLLGGGSFDTDSGSRTGYVVGAGVEFAFTNHLSLQAEYSYVDLGSETIFDDPAFASVDEDVDFHMIKAALNYRF